MPGGLASGHIYRLTINGVGDGGIGTYTGIGPI